MARPQSVSDEEILGAARHVISRSGYDGFTLSEVAAEVGLSRAAVILRFRSTHALRARLLSEGIQGFLKRLAALPVRKGGDGLLDLADFLGGNLKVPENVSHFSTILRGTIRDPELAALEQLRSQTWHAAIVERMPESSVGIHDAARLFAAILVGAISQWESAPAAGSTAYLRQRTQDWLILAGIAFEPRPALQAAADLG